MTKSIPPLKLYKQRAWKKGLRAESYAAWFLRFKGYRILAWRYKTPVGEVDLIAKRGNTIVFVEVKQRATVTAALFAVTHDTHKRIRATARWWLAQNPRYANATLRFDVIAFGQNIWPHHVVNAFFSDY